MHRARMFQKPFRTFAFAAAFATSVPGSTFASGWIAVCSPPDGQRSEYGDLRSLDGASLIQPENGFVRGTDSYSGVHPVLIYPGDGATELSVIWGNTKPEGVAQGLLTGEVAAKPAAIIRSRADRIDAIELYSQETWFMSIYPFAGAVFATRHKSLSLGALGWSVDATTFEMRCNFTEFRG